MISMWSPGELWLYAFKFDSQRTVEFYGLKSVSSVNTFNLRSEGFNIENKFSSIV